MLSVLMAWMSTLTQGQEPEGPGVNRYLWMDDGAGADTIRSRIPPPSGFLRVPAEPLSWGDWLRYLPVLDTETVHYHDGDVRRRAQAAAVIDMPIGTGNVRHGPQVALQLRAEYLFSLRKHEAIHFRALYGEDLKWTQWASGLRVVTERHRPRWVPQAEPDWGYENLKAFVAFAVHEVGSMSFEESLQPVESVDAVRLGDVLVDPAFPGHLMVVVDLAEHPGTGQRAILLGQGMRPAQAFHVVLNPANRKKPQPWFFLSHHEKWVTPDHVFEVDDFRRFP